MFQLRFHGRGGQGVVTAAELLSVAAFLDGKFAQAFPSFGPERTGAPVTAFCRIDERPIRTHEPIDRPNVVIVQDVTLLRAVHVLDGLAADGWILVNSKLAPAELGLSGARAHVIAASDIARRELGRPLPNAAMLGAVAALTNAVTLGSVVGAIEARFTGTARSGNVAAARAAHDALLLETAC